MEYTPMDEELLQSWLDGITGFILKMKERGEPADHVAATVVHDMMGIQRTMFEGDQGFLPRSFGYKKYCPDEPKCAGVDNQCTCSKCIPLD